MTQAIIIVNIIAIAIIAYQIGEQRASVDEFKKGIEAAKKTLNTLVEAQQYAGVTPKQVKKMNEFVIKNIQGKK